MRILRTLTSLLMVALAAIGQEALTNEAILKMLKAGLSDDIVVSTINSQPGKYATTPDDLIALKAAGVPEKVIASMVSKVATPKPANGGIAVNTRYRPRWDSRAPQIGSEPVVG